MKRVAIFTALVLVGAICHAHHGTGGQFDQSQSLEVSGVVTKIRFVNPHSYVYFDVTDEDGNVDAWRCEMRAATVLKRSGWSADMFKPGTRIHIDGVPARREPHGCYVNEISLDDGEAIQRYQQLGSGDGPDVAERVARLESGEPNLGGDWAAPQRLPTEQEVRDIALGRRVRGGGRRYEQTQAGIDASGGYVREDNPRFHCQATNILMDWTFDQHINRITQNEQSITFTYGFMDIVRTIHMITDEHPDGIRPTRAGHSIGSWDGDTLVVDTIGFSEGYLDTRSGVKHSEQLHIVERFTMDPQEGSLTRSYIGDDAVYLAASFEGQDKIFLSETPFDPYNCEDLTEEIVEGMR